MVLNHILNRYYKYNIKKIFVRLQIACDFKDKKTVVGTYIQNNISVSSREGESDFHSIQSRAICRQFNIIYIYTLQKKSKIYLYVLVYKLQIKHVPPVAELHNTHNFLHL